MDRLAAEGMIFTDYYAGGELHGRARQFSPWASR